MAKHGQRWQDLARAGPRLETTSPAFVGDAGHTLAGTACALGARTGESHRMARLFYMSLPGVGDWSAAMRESGAQLAPYRTYLITAKRAADNRVLSLAWRPPTSRELRELERRVHERIARAARRSDGARRRRDRHGPREGPSGPWIMLEARPGRAEEPETTFDAFLKAKDVHERPPVSRGRSMTWMEGSKIDILAFDREALALLLSRAPTEIPAPTADSTKGAVPSAAPEGPVLFLRPNTWPLECQRRTLEAMQDRPSPRVAPLLRLVSTRPTWEQLVPAKLEEDDWVFLRGEHGALRDGTTEQRALVERALGTPDFAVLEGPPGSGKTTAICELIVQLTREHKRVLLVASTHVAVDNVLERLIEWQDDAEEKLVMPIRIGDEDNVTSRAVEAWTLRRLLRTWNDEILDHVDRPRGAQPEGAAARAMLKEALTRKGEESVLARFLLDASNLVCGTTIGILQHPAIKAARKDGGDIEPFDMLILDEASKTTFTEFLVPAAYAKRWVVVGDRRQLSPYVEEQDLAENLRGLLRPAVARAAVYTFLASAAVPRGRRARSLVAVDSDEEADLIADEAKARGVEALDLDEAETTQVRGIRDVCVDLLCADVVFGDPDTIAAWEHRLPGDLQVVAGAVPELADWEAHRRALEVRSDDEAVTWAGEVAWRQVRAYELRYNLQEQEHLLLELKALEPRTLGDWFFEKRQPRTLRDGRTQTPNDMLEEDLANMRRVSMPSILEILQRGAGSLGWDHKTALTDGLPERVLAERMVSLSFQHRMHPEISAFPRMQFYQDALLKDASGMGENRRWTYGRYARRATWIDIAPRARGRHRSSPGNRNLAEAEAMMKELAAFVQWAATAPHPRKGPQTPWEVAVLTFYRSQEDELRVRLQGMSGQHGNTRNFRLPDGDGRVHVTLCTVDRFQGHEADLVLLSFVKSGSPGFLNSPNRLNVALTRARYQLVLVGDRSWMASAGCRSELLRDLGASPMYAHDIGWEDA
ncbi:AAA domain-containing protein [Sorangium sp. So ce307]